VPENSEETWLPYEACVNKTVVDMEYLRKSYAIGGCDLSATTDLTCASLLIRKPKDPHIYALQKYFIPEARVNATEQSSNIEAPYRLWAKEGWIEICKGATVDFHAVTAWFVQMVKEYNIRPLWLCYDRALSGYWVPEMEEWGFEMEKIAQGPFAWTYPMKEMGGALTDHLVVYQNNPILRWCLNNTAKKSTNEKGVESIQPIKKASNLRIDGMVSLLNAWVGYSKHIDEYLSYLR
jgi:phage terminase large subunit-like protein